MLKNGEFYVELGPKHFDRQNKSRTAHRLVRRLTDLGFQVAIQPIGM